MTQDRPIAGIFTYKSHTAYRGHVSYQGVDLATGTVLFSEQAGNGVPSVGEFLALAAAARYILEHRYNPAVIYASNTTAIGWYRAGRASVRRRCPDVLRAEVFLCLMGAPLALVEIRHWGDAPADFGGN